MKTITMFVSKKSLQILRLIFYRAPNIRMKTVKQKEGVCWVYIFSTQDLEMGSEVLQPLVMKRVT